MLHYLEIIMLGIQQEWELKLIVMSKHKVS